jgi:hypothetical protein
MKARVLSMNVRFWPKADILTKYELALEWLAEEHGGSRKGSKGVHLQDLVRYIDDRRATGQKRNPTAQLAAGVTAVQHTARPSAVSL